MNVGIKNAFAAAVLLTVLSLPKLAAQSPLVLTGQKAEYDFAGCIRTVRDPSGTKTLEEMLPLLAARAPEPVPEPNFGYTTDTVWALVNVGNDSVQTDFFLYFEDTLDQVTVYVSDTQNQGPVLEMTSGVEIPVSRRPYPHRLPVFPLSLERGHTYSIAVKIRDDGNMNLPLYLFARDAFHAHDTLVVLFFGVMFGVLSGLLLYVIFLIIYSKARSYIYYVFFSVCHLLFQLANNGFSGRYFWPELPALEDFVLAIGAAGATIFGIGFAQVFLQTRKNARVFHVLLIILLVLLLAVPVPLAFFGLTIYSIGISNIVMVISVILISICSIKVYLAGYKAARFYILAYISLIISVLIQSLKNFNVYPGSFFIGQIVLIGAVIESILLSLAIADRINALRFENQEIQIQLLESRESEIKILKDKFYLDSMTGLANRNRLILDLQKEESCSLFVVNIDKFRQINDLYGTLIGNKVIIETACRIRENKLPGNRKVYRFNADDFAVTVQCEFASTDVTRMADGLHRLCQERPHEIDLYEIPVSVTIRIAGGGENLLGQADIALSQARESQKEILAYAPEIDATSQILSNLKTIRLLRHAAGAGDDRMTFPPPSRLALRLFARSAEGWNP